MPKRRRWLSILIAASMFFVGLQSVALASASDEAGFLDKINAERSARGLAPLVMDESLRGYARDHSQFQADGKCPNGKSICHYNADPAQDAKFKAAAGSGWSRLGENVGVGSSVGSLHNAFMNSAGHCKNILGDYNYVGIGVVQTNRKYVTVAFMKKGGSAVNFDAEKACKAPSTTTPSPTTTTTAPKPTTTTQPKPTTTKPAAKPTTTAAKPSPSTTAAPSTTTTTEAPTTTTTTMPPLFVLHSSGMTLFEWVVDVFGPAMWCNDLSRRHWSCID